MRSQAQEFDPELAHLMSTNPVRRQEPLERLLLYSPHRQYHILRYKVLRKQMSSFANIQRVQRGLVAYFNDTVLLYQLRIHSRIGHRTMGDHIIIHRTKQGAEMLYMSLTALLAGSFSQVSRSQPFRRKAVST